MKRIIIAEDELNMLRESVLLDTLPDDIISAVMRKKTSLGNNPALPDIFDEGFLERVVNMAFEDSKQELIKMGSINDVDSEDPIGALNELIKMCQDKEREIRPQLEKICYNYVIQLFKVPENDVELSFKLVDKVDTGRDSIILDPIDGDDELEFADIIDAQSIKGEVYKRRLLDSLIMGASMRLSSDIKSYIREIYEIDPDLAQLYKKILSLNTYLLFTREDLNLTEENMKQLGTVEVTLGNDVKKNRIESQGVIFPILLSETIRGFMELFVSHGLPNDLERAKAVIGKSDFLKNEPWDMRIGPTLWDMVSNQFDGVDSTTIPYILYFMSKIPVKKFNYFFKEVFAGTRKGKRLLRKITDMSIERQNEVENDGSEMEPQNARKSILSDNIDPEEL